MKAQDVMTQYVISVGPKAVKDHLAWIDPMSGLAIVPSEEPSQHPA